MRQADLMATVLKLKPGQAIDLAYQDIKEAADGEFTGLDLFCGGARRCDVLEFMNKISTNWGFTFTENEMTETFTMKRSTKKS